MEVLKNSSICHCSISYERMVMTGLQSTAKQLVNLTDVHLVR